ncbi:MAG TPA: DUF4118 domain-containing protein, partial [Novosphingobium sp.]
ELVSTARTPLSAYSLTLLICLAAAGIAAPLYWVLDLSNIAMLFLLSVVVAALFLGRGPAIFAAVINVLAFDFLYVPPRFTFAVSDVQYLLTFAVMLGVGLLVGQLTAGLKFQATVSATRENRVRALYELSRDLSGALLPVQIAEACDRFAEAQFDAKAALLIADDDNRLQPPIGPAERLAPVDPAIAQWAFDHGEAAGRGTDTLPGSPALYLPLRAPMRVRGVMVLEPRDPERLMNPEQQRFLDTLSRVLAIAIERVHFVDVAQATTVQMESERLRNSLLSAISHDLRTPLAAMVGLADTLLLQPPSLSAEQQEVAKAMKDEARRMSSQVGNLLDMARLQAGRVELKRDWRPLDEVVGCTLRSLQAPLREHQVGTALADDLPLLHIDAALMERVLGNLLENAAKYTPPGSRIEIGAAREGSDVEVWVADNGPGLPVGKEEEIFKKFERGQKESATPGIGLGLAICRAIIEAHGGHIRAENRHGGGARFVFTLPQGNPPGIVDADSGGQA